MEGSPYDVAVVLAAGDWEEAFVFTSKRVTDVETICNSEKQYSMHLCNVINISEKRKRCKMQVFERLVGQKYQLKVLRIKN